MVGLQAHTRWCIVRYYHGRFERVREGYKSAENARKGIDSVVRADMADGIDASATYAVGSYTVGTVVVHGAYRRKSA